MQEPPSDMLRPPAHPVQKGFRQEELEDLINALKQDGVSHVRQAAELIGMDVRRAKDLVRREIARVITQEHIKGNITATAQEIGLPFKFIWNQMQQDGFLKTVNGHTDPEKHLPQLEDTLSRETLTENELSEIGAIMREDAALSSLKWEKIGINPERASELMQLEDFARDSLKSTLDLTHGGMVRCFAEMLHLFVKTKEAFDADALPIEETEFGPKDAKKEYLYALAALSGEIRQINNQVMRSNILKIKRDELELAKRAISGGGQVKKGRKGIPGFSEGPPPVLIQVNSHGATDVNVSRDE